MLYFKSTILPKMSDVVSIENMPIDMGCSSFEKRIKKLFMKMFGKSMIEEEAYWSKLFYLLTTPGKGFNIVAIDGYTKDFVGKEDLGIVLNMGRPRLRARNVHNLDRIYLELRTSGRVEFWNSTVDSEEEPHFMYGYKTPAHHPHISGGKPCLGTFSNTLARFKNEGNPFMYLITTKKFLNSWNRRSPYWDLNWVPNHYTFTNKKGRTKKVLYNRLFKYGTVTGTAQRNEEANKHFLNFLKENIFKLKCKSIDSEIVLLSKLYSKTFDYKEHIKTILSKRIIDSKSTYMKEFDAQFGTASDKYDDSLSARDSEERRRISSEASERVHFGHTYNRLRDNLQFYLKKRKNGNSFLETLSGEDNIMYTYYNSKEFRYIRILFFCLSRNIARCYTDYLKDEDLNPAINEVIDVYLKLQVKYLIPMQNYYNIELIKLSKKYDMRNRLNAHSEVLKKNNPEVYLFIKDMNVKIAKRERRINNFIEKRLAKSLNDMKVGEFIDAKVKESVEIQFYFNKYANEWRVDTMGSFWGNLGSASPSNKNEMNEILNLLKIKQMPQDFENLIKLYELTKSRFNNKILELQTKQLSIIKRKAGYLSYEDKISSSQQNSEQVPLSFEAVS